jgi:hypothetical protein
MALQEQIRTDMVNAMISRDTETLSIKRVVAGEKALGYCYWMTNEKLKNKLTFRLMP